MLRSPRANARLVSIDLDAARSVAGVHSVVGPGDVPLYDDEQVLTDEPPMPGRRIAAVAAETVEAATAALEALAPSYEVLDFLVDLDEGVERQRFLGEPSDESAAMPRRRSRRRT